MVRFCLAIGHQAWKGVEPAANVRQTFHLVDSAERAGFDSVWVSEDPDGWDAFALLGALATRTSRIRLGTGVTNPFLRHPNLIAMSVATVDALSGGRAFLGLGRGQPEWYRDALGMAPTSPLATLESTIDLLEQWWRAPHVASGRDPFPVHAWERAISPLGRPPIYVAATGPKALELAGRVADGVRFNELASVQYLSSAIRTVRERAQAAGRDPDALSFFVHPSIEITDDPEATLERKKGIVTIIHALPGMERQLETPGVDVDAVMRRVRGAMRTGEVLARGGGFPELRRSGDRATAKAAIPMELMANVAAVGTPAAVRARLAELREAGATHFFLDLDRLPGGPDQATEILAEIDPDQ